MRLKSVLLLTDYCYIDIRTAINVQDRTDRVFGDVQICTIHGALRDVQGVCVHSSARGDNRYNGSEHMDITE